MANTTFDMVSLLICFGDNIPKACIIATNAGQQVNHFCWMQDQIRYDEASLDELLVNTFNVHLNGSIHTKYSCLFINGEFNT
jgi:hypothetical protein